MRGHFRYMLATSMLPSNGVKAEQFCVCWPWITSMSAQCQMQIARADSAELIPLYPSRFPIHSLHLADYTESTWTQRAWMCWKCGCQRNVQHGRCQDSALRNSRETSQTLGSDEESVPAATANSWVTRRIWEKRAKNPWNVPSEDRWGLVYFHKDWI